MKTTAGFIKLTSNKATEVCSRFELPDDAQAILREGISTGLFLELLINQQKYLAAIDVLAHALPKREAVWWGCLCARQTGGAEFSPKDRDALKAVAQWVLEPSEENRQGAGPPGEATGYKTPAGCLALAVFGSGGSLTPPNLPPVPPDPSLTGKTVSGGVKLAATKGDPLKIPLNHRQFAELGMEFAKGRLSSPHLKKKP
jgi:hypothetical protein